MSPESMASWMSLGDWPLTVQPIEKAVPRISLQVPESFLAMDLGRIVRAISMIWSRVMLPSCLMFLTFFLSRSGSFRAFMTRAEAEGTTETVATLLTMVSLTMIPSPFQSMVAFWMSSPIFLGDRPRGPILGAREAAAAISPPTALMITIFSSAGGGGPPMFPELFKNL
ncbi:unnamed protein product, partial [Heterosigma akashiwo]